MSSPLPPDPYNALGVAKDATGAQIKTVYRKLVLKCHPDKILDPTKKQAAVDEFHKIQTAYEIIGDEQRRQRYD
ncbi:heat shock protein DnaJ, partial [Polychaeton citri CBS 116435]